MRVWGFCDDWAGRLSRWGPFFAELSGKRGEIALTEALKIVSIAESGGGLGVHFRNLEGPGRGLLKGESDQTTILGKKNQEEARWGGELAW